MKRKKNRQEHFSNSRQNFLDVLEIGKEDNGASHRFSRQFRRVGGKDFLHNTNSI